MPQSHLRAGDADRAAVATALGRHMAAGRLTVDEYDERLGRAYAARTYGELAELTADLPSTGRGSAPEASPSRAPAPTCGPMGGPWAWRGHGYSAWQSWLRTALIVIAIWAVSSIASAGLLYFWPIWVLGPWGAVLLAQTVTGGGHHGRRRQRDDRRAMYR
jgi:hypothetical protein